jgi:site-specific DNA-methyltransferase (adenine-specific)
MNERPRFSRDGSTIWHADVRDLYAGWESPVVIISDGAYGLSMFLGDPAGPEALPAWYAPHVQAWSEKSTPLTTLWFWNTEIGWANVHPLLVGHGWEYRRACTWDKGIAHGSAEAHPEAWPAIPIPGPCANSRP